jgi:hypothetical protein
LSDDDFIKKIIAAKAIIKNPAIMAINFEGAISFDN